WIVNHKINALVRFSPKRPADMPASVPFVNELATSQEQKDLLDVLNGSGELGRPYIVARQVPAERVKTLRAAFEATIKDETFLAEDEEADPADRSGARRGGRDDHRDNLFGAARADKEVQRGPRIGGDDGRFPQLQAGNAASRHAGAAGGRSGRLVAGDP